MGLRSLLARMESSASSLVPLQSSVGGTATDKADKGGSPCPLSSLKKNQTEYNTVEEGVINIDPTSTIIKTICECGYRPPFCACGYYKFPS